MDKYLNWNEMNTKYKMQGYRHLATILRSATFTTGNPAHPTLFRSISLSMPFYVPNEVQQDNDTFIIDYPRWVAAALFCVVREPL